MAKAKSSYSRGRGIGLLRQAPGAPRDTECAGGGVGHGQGQAGVLRKGAQTAAGRAIHHTWRN